MDPADYIPMFLSESQEHLQELNLAVVKLEESPEDRDTIDAIFRIAHSLKGMSATMGFAAIAELTHEMENVFETLRQRTGGLSRDVVDTVLACLDALETAIGSIETSGKESLDPAPLIERLRTLARAEDAEREEQAQQAAAPQAIADPPGVAIALSAGAPVRRIDLELAEDCAMPSVRVYMAFSALADYGELAATVPDPEKVEEFRGRNFAAWLVSDVTNESLTSAVSMVSDIASIGIREIPADSVAPSATDAGDAVDHKEDNPAAATAADASTGSRTTRTVRVDAERLDQLMHFMGEVVIHRTAVEMLAAKAQLPELGQAVQELARSSQALQAMVMQVRMIPVEAVFLRFPRLVRDLSSKLDKEVELKLVGKDTELDRTVVDALGDPLVHLVRNALDHGLEGPQERERAGKPRQGCLEISARHAGGAVVIDVRDDGHGIDPARVAAVALERGLITAEAAEAVDMPRAIELLFTAGFSTAAVTSDISGRGVGMDVVRTKIRELGGEIVMDSTLGVGTSAQIRLPLTLAIVAGLIIEVGKEAFAIPIERVERTLRLDKSIVRSVAGRPVLALDDGVITLLDGHEAFGMRRTTEPDPELAVIVRGSDCRLAIGVSALVGQRELVTRPVPPIVSDEAAVSGGAVLSDGRVALIVDCDALSARVMAPRKDPLSSIVPNASIKGPDPLPQLITA